MKLCAGQVMAREIATWLQTRQLASMKIDNSAHCPLLVGVRAEILVRRRVGSVEGKLHDR
jgi:hypothetical protein